ncbi:MAG: LruC domain-containing protein [Pseudomonadales bacterium]|nr:LruC domain-containing protein [Pseudomonadales bacterium]
MISKYRPLLALMLFLYHNQSGAIEFSYLNGSEINGYTAKGTPTNIMDRSDEMPLDVLNNIYSMLPESQYVDPSYIDASLASNIVVDSDFDGYVTVQITFLNEGAGYRNTFGYFIYDYSNPPTTIDQIDEHVIVFPNASKPSQGELVQGDSVDLYVELLAGEALGFFVIPNGWGWSGSYGYVSSMGPWGQAFYSLPVLNPESGDLRQHNVVFYDTENELFIVGFDDQHRSSGDNDFNDILFAIETTPFYAVEGINEDGSVNEDSYQLLEQSNTELTSTTYYPSLDEKGTLMFEDLWPVIGDYDFNDLVISYRFKHTLNNRNQMISMILDFEVQAIGASFHNGLAIHLPNVPAGNVSSSQLVRDGEILSTDILDPNNSEANLILLTNASRLVSSGCDKYRTYSHCKEPVNTSFSATIQFHNPVALQDIGSAPYDPYIFAINGEYHGLWNSRDWELHLKQFTGSDRFNTYLLGQAEDASANGQFYLNANGFPWVLSLPDEWSQTQEGVDILKAYPKLKTWVTSSGEEDTDWYLRTNANIEYLYD